MRWRTLFAPCYVIGLAAYAADFATAHMHPRCCPGECCKRPSWHHLPLASCTTKSHKSHHRVTSLGPALVEGGACKHTAPPFPCQEQEVSDTASPPTAQAPPSLYPPCRIPGSSRPSLRGLSHLIPTQDPMVKQHECMQLLCSGQCVKHLHGVRHMHAAPFKAGKLGS
jgi:hypothetical protein